MKSEWTEGCHSHSARCCFWKSSSTWNAAILKTVASESETGAWKQWNIFLSFCRQCCVASLLPSWTNSGFLFLILSTHRKAIVTSLWKSELSLKRTFSLKFLPIALFALRCVQRETRMNKKKWSKLQHFQCVRTWKPKLGLFVGVTATESVPFSASLLFLQQSSKSI